MKVLTVATRGGPLAVAQTEIVIAALKKSHPDIQVKIKTVTTKGDRDRRTALWNLKDTGFFTSRLEDTLLAGEADFAVHSFKDLPTRQREGLITAAVCDRQFVEDCLISASPVDSIKKLPTRAKIGTSSVRRAAQLKRLRPDIEPTPIRGNVQTRLKKLDKGEFDAIVLARAGLERLGLGEKISFVFDPAEFIPAPAQGALAVQTKTDDILTNELIASIDDEMIRTATFAERKILTTMQCGCHAPVGAFAKITKGQMRIHAFISDLQGENFITCQTAGPIDAADNLAGKLATELLQCGGKQILASLEE